MEGKEISNVKLVQVEGMNPLWMQLYKRIKRNLLDWGTA